MQSPSREQVNMTTLVKEQGNFRSLPKIVSKYRFSSIFYISAYRVLTFVFRLHDSIRQIRTINSSFSVQRLLVKIISFHAAKGRFLAQ